MLSVDFLKDIHDFGVYLATVIFGFLVLVVRTIFTNKAQIELLKKELTNRFEAREKHDEEMKQTMEKLEQTIENTREQILDLWKTR